MDWTMTVTSVNVESVELCTSISNDYFRKFICHRQMDAVRKCTSPRQRVFPLQEVTVHSNKKPSVRSHACASQSAATYKARRPLLGGVPTTEFPESRNVTGVEL
jgi:hypothetical protein